MKKKIAIIVAATLLVACLALGLASCSPDVNNNEKEINVYVGTSVKNILEADFAGFEVNNLTDYWQSHAVGTGTREESIRVNYATGDYDYVNTEIYSEYGYTYDPDTGVRSIDDYYCVDEYYCRNGQLFSNTYKRIKYNQDESKEKIKYSNGIELEFENRRTCMDIEAAKIGLAMMLSAYENVLRNGYWLEDAPEDGIWTGEVVLYPQVSEFADSYELRDMGFLEALHNIAWFKYATAPITQEQLKQLLTALALMDEDCAEIADLIVKSGTLKEGQSAYDYLMGAFDVIFADVTKTYEDYVIEDLVPKYLSGWNFEDCPFSVICDTCFSEILNWFDTGIYRLVIGEFGKKYNEYGEEYDIISDYDFHILKFSETGELVGIKLDERTSVPDEDADIRLDLTFSDTPFTLENIDDKETFYIVPHEDDNDMVTAYVDTVANFANKQLENVKHSDMKTYGSFKSLYRELIGYNQIPNSPPEDYVIFYEDDNDQYNQYYYQDQHTLVKGDEIMHYNPNGEYYFRSENDEWWAYRKIYSSNNYIWKKVKLDEAPEMYTYDPFKLLASIIYDEKDLGEQYYFANFVWKDNEYEFECDGYKMRLTPDAELFIDDEDGKTIEIWLEDYYYGTPASQYERLYEIFSSVPTAVESNAKPGKQTFDAALKASLEAKSVTYKTVDTWGTESQPRLLDFENNICKICNRFDEYYIFEDGTMYGYYYNMDSHYTKQNSSRKYEDVFVLPVKEFEGRTYEDMDYDPFNEEFYFTKDDVKYTLTIASGYINKMTVKEGNTTTTYKFSHYGTTSITLPKYRLTDKDLSAALKKTLEVSSYTATRRFKSGITVVEQFDHKNQLASAKWTNADNETMLNILRAVTEEKVWMYSDASGQWLRAELDFDPATYIDSLSELMSFKSDVESRFPSGEYYFNCDYDKDEYTFKNANFDCVITFKDGYLATLGLSSGADAVLEFSDYNEVALALPTLGHANEDVWTAFTQAVENSSNAANFHMEFEGIISDMPLTYETDVIKGVKSLTTAYVVTATAPGKFTRLDMLQMYREWGGNITTTWTRSAEPTMSGQFVLGSWSSAVRTTAPEETHKTDMWFYNFAAPLTAVGLPLDVLFVLSKYDKATGEYIVYGYDATDMHVVEYRVKVQDGFIAEVTISDEALLKSLGMQNESLKVSYSKYNETTLDRPQGIK